MILSTNPYLEIQHGLIPKPLFFFFLESVEDSWDYGLRDAMFTACKVGDIDTLRSLLQPPGDTAESSDPSGTTSTRTLLSKPIDLSGFTLLHVASAAAQKGAVRLLLDAGSDPACR